MVMYFFGIIHINFFKKIISTKLENNKFSCICNDLLYYSWNCNGTNYNSKLSFFLNCHI